MIKEAKTYKEQLATLKKKGLIIYDDEGALSILKNINYYIFSGYLKEFLLTDDTYEAGTTFDRIYHIMEFDRKIRNIILLAIEPIEHTLKTKISYLLAHKYGSLGYLNSKNFHNPKFHKMAIDNLKSNIKKNKGLDYVKHHNEKYDGQFPIWVAINLFSLGMTYNFYSNLKDCDKKEISSIFNTSPKCLDSWLDSLSYLRNIVAHYMRLYNQKIKKTPIPCPVNHLYSIPTHKIFDIIYTMKFLTLNTDEWFIIVDSLDNLFKQYENYIDLNRIGFPDNWLELFKK